MTRPEPDQNHPAIASIERLVHAMDDSGSSLCLGLDPDVARLPHSVLDGSSSEATAIETWSLGVLEAVAPIARVVKPQSACFERFGSRGFAALERVASRARELGYYVLLDAKRGDIGVSARHYAESAAGMGADAITASPYLGAETIEPFLERGLAVFLLVRTSNPGSAQIQQKLLGDGASVAELVATVAADLGARYRSESSGLSAVGAVVGATQSAEGASLRALMPNQVFLTPGVGAQGARAQDLAPMRRSPAIAERVSSEGLLVPISRAILYPDTGADSPEFHASVAQRAAAWRDELAV